MSGVLSVFGPFVENHPLLSIFVFLLLFGFTLPITEEIALALCGVFSRGEDQNFLFVWGAAFAALIIADLIYFGIARYFGPRLLRFKYFAKLVKPEKVMAGERYFIRRGPRIVFICRFVVGLRMPGIIGAGLLRMNARKFIAYDGAALLIGIPIWLGAGWALGAQFDTQTGWIMKAIAVATPIAVVVGSYLVYRSVRADREQSEKEGAEEE